jgi:Na+/H+ antiporter NhaC
MLLFVALVAITGRDFGPMWRAERRARTTGKVLGDDAKVDPATAHGAEIAPADDVPKRAINAVLPVLVLVGGVVWGLFATGEGDSLRDVIGSADSYKALMWASLASVIAAAVLALSQRILTLEEVSDAWFAGVRSMVFAMIILVLAWSLAATTEQLHTGDFLGSALAGALPAGLVPAVVFIVAALLAFATGTSWGTMGILMPLVVPVTWQILGANGMADPDHYYVLYAAVSCVLAGAVWGDHCSPISDTTILSSTASGSDHVAHVRTQLPYAVLVGMVGLALGTIPSGFGVPWWIGMVAAAAVVAALLRYFGRPVDDAHAAEAG